MDKGKWEPFCALPREAQIERIRALRRQGMTEKDVARALGVSDDTLYKQKKLLGLERSPGRLDTLCWDCTKATGGCSWSRRLEPVEGWKAIPTKLQSNRAGEMKNSYIVTSCPEFDPDKRRE